MPFRCSRPRCSRWARFVLTGTVDPAKAFAGFANSSVSSGRRRLPGGECGGEVRSRTSHQPARGERIRTVHAWTGLQHLSHRRPDRASVSEQYGARRRALSDHSFSRSERRLQAGRRRNAPHGRLSHVLRHGEPERLVGSMAHRHLRQSDRCIACGAIRREDHLRHLAAGLRRFRRWPPSFCCP